MLGHSELALVIFVSPQYRLQRLTATRDLDQLVAGQEGHILAACFLTSDQHDHGSKTFGKIQDY